MPVPLDEFPLHQAPLSLEYVASSDRNFYDRSYFNAHRRTDELFFITGFGVYPNLGTKDAYALLRRGDQQSAVHFSDAIDDDRLNQKVGAYRVEVVEPLRTLRLVCDDDSLGLSFDLRWEGSFDAVEEQHHIMRTARRPILDACRFAQLGSWSGTLSIDGDDLDVDPDVWVGSRDRSWGIRPVGEPEPPGRNADEPLDGFWWLYVPLRFDDFAVVLIVQELPDGFRTLNDATRVWADGRVEQLGWPRVDITYRSGTRHPERATIELSTPDGKPLTLEVETLLAAPIHVGGGYGGDPDWGHGQWRGRAFAERVTYDLNDPAVAGRVPFGVIDHVGHGWFDGQEGWGLFEHGTFGRHDPSGFADWGSLAP
jgi:hypothetical protein